MKNIFNIVKMAALILPMVIELVRSIESKAPGAEKKQAVLAISRLGMEKSGAGAGLIESVLSIADGVIDITVDIFNKSGEFEKGGSNGDPVV
jgi:hypothetical protein